MATADKSSKLSGKFKQKRHKIHVQSDSQQENHRFLIPYNNKLRKLWDYLIIVTAIYSTFFVPINLAFKPVSFGLWYTIVDITTTLLYVADIII